MDDPGWRTSVFKGRRGESFAPAPRQGRFALPSRLPHIFLAAACIAVCFLIACLDFVYHELERVRRPWANAMIIELPVPGEGTRAPASPPPVADAERPCTLVLAVLDNAADGGYAVDLLRSEDHRLVWSADDLKPIDSSFILHFPPHFLEAGFYSIQVYGVRHGRRHKVAHFELQVANGA